MIDQYFEPHLVQSVSRLHGLVGPKRLAQAIDYAMFPGGARMRPKICLSVAQACGMDRPELTLRAACSLEMLHCASLVHDDLPCFDDADFRRGKPSVHKVFGEAIAVLAGDALIVAAFQNLVSSDLSDSGDRVLKMLRILGTCAGSPSGLSAGQAWESEDEIDTEVYHCTKTASLFIAACQMGAVSAGAEAEDWGELGLRLGDAFQVADDIKDASSTSMELGKPVGQDLLHDRPSMVRTLGFASAVSRLQNLVSGAIAAVPACEGREKLCQVIRMQARQFMPRLQGVTAAVE